MTAADLDAACATSNAAFGALFGLADEAEVFGPGLFTSRFEADPTGCFVAAAPGDPSKVIGSLLSVARGPLAWFGPVAVDPGAQQGGAGAALVEACLAGWRERGVRTMGLETLADSAHHVRFYSRFGFRPSWTGVAFEAPLRPTGMPGGIEIGGALPPLDFLYPGIDLAGEAAATARLGCGKVLSTHDGLAICHTEPTFQHAGVGFVPFLAAASRESFDRLLGAAEHLCHGRGLESMLVRVPGSSWGTMVALRERGYQAGRVMVRMKAGALLDYDRAGLLYLDNWL
jgi:GNAT superfamily N-acetyltransferase